MCKVARLSFVVAICLMLGLPSIARADLPHITYSSVTTRNRGEAFSLHDGFSDVTGGYHSGSRMSASGTKPAQPFPISDITSNKNLINSLIVVTSLAASGPNTLRSAIRQANEQAGDDIIVIGIAGTIVLTGTLEISSNIVISGPGASLLAISGNHLYRVFYVNGASINFWIKGVSIVNGNATGGNGGSSRTAGGGGAAAGIGGALFINQSAFVTVTDVIFVGNVAKGGNGGAVYSSTIGGGGGGGGGIGGNGESAVYEAGGYGGSGEPLGPQGVGGKGGSAIVSIIVTPNSDGGILAVYGFNGGEFGGGGGGAGMYLTVGSAGGNGGLGGGGGGDTNTANGTNNTGGRHGGDGGNGTATLGGGGGGGGGLGGAIFIRAGALRLENCTFDSNSAIRGTGGPVSEDPSKNGKDGQGKGGAIYIYEEATAFGKRLVFTGNGADDHVGSETDNQDVYGVLNVNLEIAKTTLSSQVKPGDVVTFTLTCRNQGDVTATDITLADIMPSLISVTQITASGIVITNTNVTPGYVWQTSDISASGYGVITVTGVLPSPLARGLTITNSATFTGTLGADQDKSSSFVVLRVLNVAPEMMGGMWSINENVAPGTLVGIPITGNDNNSDSLTYNIIAGNTNNAFMIDAVSGQLAVNNSLDFETKAQYVLTVQASDGLLGATAAITVNILDVNDPPYFSSAPVNIATQDSAYFANVVAVDPDAGAVLTITAVSKPSWLIYTPTSNRSGTLSGTPANEDVGLYSVILRVEDEFGLTGTQAYSLTVININDRPTFTSIPITTSTQDELYTYVISTTDIDLPGDVLTITSVHKPTWLILGQTTSGVATLDGTPSNDDVGNHQVTLQVTDNGGLTSTQVYTFVVVNVNDAPSFTSSPVTVGAEDRPYFYSINVDDPDIPWDEVLTISVLIKPDWLNFQQIGSVTGSLTGTPTLTGTSVIELLVTDRSGLTSTQSYIITIYEDLYNLTVGILGDGDVAVVPNLAEYFPGEEVTLTATPTTGWYLASWDGAASGVLTETKITINENTVVTATFDRLTYTLVVEVVGSGQVTVQPQQDAYLLGEVVTVTANADWSWLFDRWSGGITSPHSARVITMTEDMFITANFTSKRILLPRVSK